jgi:Do/DeqQ family serine protease
MPARQIAVGLGLLLVGLLAGAGLMWWLQPDPAPSPSALTRPARAEPMPVIGRPDERPLTPLPELNGLNDRFREVAQRASAAVVFIQVESRVDARRGAPDDGFHDFIPPFGRDMRRSAGSGVVVSEEGYAVTNHHVIDGAERIRVLLNDKREYEAELVGSDPTTDLAIVRLLGLQDDEAMPVVAIGDSDEVQVGEWVLAVGNPFRLTSTVTAGIVSALGRQVDIIEDRFRIEDFIQTDAAINPGNSGGALVNLRGEMVGVATAIATESGSYEGYGFAVPSNLVVRVAEDLIAYGVVRRGYLGVEIRAVTAADADALGLDRIEGVLISNVAEGAPAAEAGLRRGDVVLAVDGEAVAAPNQFQSRIARLRPGDGLALDIWRGDEQVRVEAYLIGRDDDVFRQWASGMRAPPRRPAPEPDPDPRPAPRLEAPETYDAFDVAVWGVEVRDLTENERLRFGVGAGAYLSRVDPGGPAYADGLPEGVVVTEIENLPTPTAEAARAALQQFTQSGRPILLRIQRADGTAAFYELQPLD